MRDAEIAKTVQLLDLMLEHFANDAHWTRGRYDDGNGGHWLVRALLCPKRRVADMMRIFSQPFSRLVVSFDILVSPSGFEPETY